jgi:hypothetical protein
LAVAIAAAFGFADSASAAATQANVRYTRGSACMKKFGYKL